MRIKTCHLWCSFFIMANLIFFFSKIFEAQLEVMINANEEEHVLENMCGLNPEDTERSLFMERPPQQIENLANASADFPLLPMEERKQLLQTFKKDFSSDITCKDNHEFFNETVYSKLNLFTIFESTKGPQLVRNSTNFALLDLDIQRIKCNYSLIKSDADSDVDDYKHDIAFIEEAIILEGPHNSVGVTCNATIEDLKHLLDPNNKNILNKDPKEVLPFYFEVMMYIPKFKASTIDCGGHRAENCFQCSTKSERCNGQCIWTDGTCIQRGDGNIPAYSVLILSIDSTSRFSFSRNLPETLKYLKNQGGIVLNKHHRQGENTYPNFMSLLTGALDFKEDFKGTMKNITETHKLNWAWDDWRNAGLPNMYHEDMPQFGPFNSYGRQGWGNRRPFSVYHRSAYHAMDSDKFKIRNGALSYGFQCMGNTPSYQRQFGLLRMFARTYKDVASFGVLNLSEYTHDTINLVRVMDEDLVKTFKDLIEGGLTKRTLVVVMGDHGRRYGIPGKGGWLDGNTPMMMMILPEAMKRENPQLTDIVRKNSLKLTTMQDIHKTITDPAITGRKTSSQEGRLSLILTNKGRKTSSQEGRLSLLLPNIGRKTYNQEGGLSLLNPIPSRTCEEASVPEVFCMCPHQVKLNNTDPALIKKSEEVIEKINQKVGNYTQCSPLRLKGVEWAWRDGEVYHIQLFAKMEEGGGGESVASFHAVVKEKETTEILRSDIYAKTSWCIRDPKLQKIRPFCICRA